MIVRTVLGSNICPLVRKKARNHPIWEAWSDEKKEHGCLGCCYTVEENQIRDQRLVRWNSVAPWWCKILRYELSGLLVKKNSYKKVSLVRNHWVSLLNEEDGRLFGRGSMRFVQSGDEERKFVPEGYRRGKLKWEWHSVLLSDETTPWWKRWLLWNDFVPWSFLSPW